MLVRPALVPAALAATAEQVWGPAGRRWIQQLPTRVRAVLTDWQLHLDGLLPMSMHWVGAVSTADGVPAVLKLGPPEPGHLDEEARWLELLDGRGSVRLLRAEPRVGALLLERAMPGTPLTTLGPARDEEATAALVSVIRSLHRPAPVACRLPRVDAQSDDLHAHLRDDGLLPARLVDRAAGLFAELAADAPGDVLLHGDLHHDNVLRATRSPWLAIDPHGVIGDPGYEVGSMLFNPRIEDRDPTLVALVPARVEQLADGLGMPPERVAAWGFVKAVLSQVWSCDSTVAVPTRALDVATLLEPRLG